MISSMTGFARQASITNWGEIQWEARSLNHRALDINIQLPEFCRPLEAACRQRLAVQFNRGRIEVVLKFKSIRGSNAIQQFNQTSVENLIAHSQKVMDLVPQSSPLTTCDILKWPGVLTSTDLDDSELNEEILKLFEKLVEQLDLDRRREGQAIQILLSEKIKEFKEFKTSAIDLLPEAQENLRNRIANKLEEMKLEIDAERFEQEVALILMKADVCEEMERIGLHIAELERVLSEDQEAGKRLGFVLQELGREVNTFSSKSAHYPLNSLMVDMKVVLEQIREQVQNVA